MKNKLLIIIPARAGSKRIPHKNIRRFLGKPLIAYTIKQAQQVKFADRIIVDTDSFKIAAIAKRYGAEVPWLRPRRLASDAAQVVGNILYDLTKLKKEEGYEPDYVMILQTTSPLRELGDIQKCWSAIHSGGATTVLTVCPTHPRLYHLDDLNFINLANSSECQSTNMQDWPAAYILNGCFVYIVKTSALLKERKIITQKTKAVICDKWRSVDLDTQEDWLIAELLYKNRKRLKAKI